MSDASTPEKAPEVGFDELEEARKQGAVVVDVRERDEYEKAHLPGVRLIPMSELQERWGEIPTEERVYLICQGGARSLNAATALRQAGVDAVSVAGGTGGWQKDGRPVESGPPPA
jgi:rhodanese-related sulfurtransferase